MRPTLTDEQTHPIILLRILTKKYGVDWMEWPPSVLKKTLNDDFKVPIARINVAKAMAVASIATRDEFWTKWETFHYLTQALNNNIPHLTEMQDLGVGQMMVAVDIASTIRKELKELSSEPEFAEDVARFIAAQAKHDGVWYLPEPLEFAAAYAAGKWFSCPDCGSEGEVIHDDGVCDICTDRLSTESLGSWVSHPELLKKSWGKSIKTFEKNPTAKVKSRLEKALASPNVTLHENSADICAVRLIVALNYMGKRREQLKEQENAD